MPKNSQQPETHFLTKLHSQQITSSGLAVDNNGPILLHRHHRKSLKLTQAANVYMQVYVCTYIFLTFF
jgi:hypothetical protein